VHCYAGTIVGFAQCVPKIATELLRMQIFYTAQQPDLSGAGPQDIAWVLQEVHTFAALVRDCDSGVWDAFLVQLLRP
jgi:hypothetical protein